MKISKKHTAALSAVEKFKRYEINEAVALMKKVSYEKFDPTVEFVIRLGLDPKRTDQLVRGAFPLPNGTGKDVRVAVICSSDKFKDAKEANADLVGDEDIIDDIQKGIIDFDVLISTPDMMAKIARVAKILGPKGLMPNPKLGTVTMDVKAAVTTAKSGRIEYRLDKDANVHVPVGKKSFEDSKLVENILSLIDELKRVKPAGSKGIYLKSAAISTTMGPGIKINIDDFRK